MFGFKEKFENPDVKESSERTFETDPEAKAFFDKMFSDYFKAESIEDQSDVFSNEVDERLNGCPIEGNGGHWEGERGNSAWVPDSNIIPKDRNRSNPENLTWGEIKEKYDIEKINFKDGDPDFSEVTKETVEIDDFTADRQANFYKANKIIAEKWGMSRTEVSEWMTNNNYSWHECRDCKTLQMVPREIHGNVNHYGGFSIAKKGEVE